MSFADLRVAVIRLQRCSPNKSRTSACNFMHYAACHTHACDLCERSPGGCAFVAASDVFELPPKYLRRTEMCTHKRDHAHWMMQAHRAPSRIINLLKNRAQPNISMSVVFARICEKCLLAVDVFAFVMCGATQTVKNNKLAN